MYASVIIDISHEKVDRTFLYRIPEELSGQVRAGVQVRVPFGAGDHLRKGYVVDTADRAEWTGGRIKEIAGVVEDSVSVQSQLIQLAWWMKERYGSTMNQALKTVLPVKQKVRKREDRLLVCRLTDEELAAAIKEASRKKYRARERLLRAFLDGPEIPYRIAAGQMAMSASTLKPMLEKGMVELRSRTLMRNPAEELRRRTGAREHAQEPGQQAAVPLNPEQRAIVDDFIARYDAGDRRPSLIYGVTGSGKTEVYMEMISHVLAKGRQVIVLIPEIALTYQTVLRFYRRFGDQVSVINSRLSAGERSDQFERAESGEVRVMIGPRSALFTPFPDLGLIIIDEEHENAYKSETSPRYHARETAEKRAQLCGAALVLGSATPSLEAYSRAREGGEYLLYRLTRRAKAGSHLARVQVVDLREELRGGNRSIFSRELQKAMERELGAGRQTMLFLNRRGYSNFVSCRSCGQAVKCPHCDVTLTLHRNGRLICHYCGYQTAAPVRCPSCGSPYVAGFGTGTQKIESMVRELFPGARVLRMDLDTTSRKGGHEEILSAFAEGEADILVGTQMIVKGHDFPNVTLVGILAADLSLYSPDFRCGERTFQLLTQAAGRAGRDDKPGQVIIQTYSPEHYAIACAARQDYESFYRQEMAYRQVLCYPPAGELLTVMLSSRDEKLLNDAMAQLYRTAAGLAMRLGRTCVEPEQTTGAGRRPERACGTVDEPEQTTGFSGGPGRAAGAAGPAAVELIGPAEAPVYKVNDIYRKILYMKHQNYAILVKIKDHLEAEAGRADWADKVVLQFDLA